VHVALNAIHLPLRLTRMELPCMGWVKYAELIPVRLESWVTSTYPAGTATGEDCDEAEEDCPEAVAACVGEALEAA
jgi:hypothetical protein